jgi:hypothetical protein
MPWPRWSQKDVCAVLGRARWPHRRARALVFPIRASAWRNSAILNASTSERICPCEPCSRAGRSPRSISRSSVWGPNPVKPLRWSFPRSASRPRRKACSISPLALRSFDPGMAAIANPGWQISVDLSKDTGYHGSELANQATPPHHDARTSSSQSFIVAFEQLARRLAPSKQAVSGLQRSLEVERLAKIGTAERQRRLDRPRVSARPRRP